MPGPEPPLPEGAPPPVGQTPGDWVDPYAHQLGWTVDSEAHAVVGNTIREANDYPHPCQDGPFPCLDADGRLFRPGRLATLTLHPARGRHLINEPDTVNQELCRKHYAYKGINSRGRMVPVIFSIPDNTVAGDNVGDIFVSVGFFTIGDNTPRQEDDLLNLCKPGRMCGVVQLKLPGWIEGTFYSHPITCGLPI